MEAKKLHELLHSESVLAMAMRAQAEAKLKFLDDAHTVSMERKLAGVAMLHGYSDWQVSVARYAFAAPYRKCGYFAGITYTLSVGTVESWSDLTPLFTALDAAGIPADLWKSSDRAAIYTRQYEATLQKDDPQAEEPAGELLVQLVAQLPGDTDTCRRVVVGYSDPVSQGPTPIYKLECNEESTDESEAQRSSDDQPL